MPGTEPKKSTPPRLPNFLSRARAMSEGGSSSWEATSIGITLVGCIGACSGLGYWLDSHFKTSYWLPILFLVGVIAGFREMFQVLGRINKEQEQKKRESREKVRLAPNPSQEQDEETPKPLERERIFKVPPPPAPGERPDAVNPAAAKQVDAKQEPESVDELIERLLQDEDEPTANRNDE